MCSIYKKFDSASSFFCVAIQVALDEKKRVFTWGFGGYGRLGHTEQKDEYRPRLVQLFSRPGRGAVQVWAGSTYCMAMNELGKFL